MKKIFLFGAVAITSIGLLLASCNFTTKGDNNMATISTLNNGDSGATIRGDINSNFSNINSELISNTTAIGTIASLNTADKTSLVAAINETNSKTGTLASLNTAVKTNLVSAINEVNTKAYGEMLDSTFTPKQITLTNIGTFYALTSGLSAGELNGITYGTSDLTIGTTGKYLITYTCSVKSDISAQFTGAIMKNSSVVANSKTTSTCAANEYVTFNCSTIMSLSASDVIELCFAKNTSSAVTFYAYYTYVTIERL